ncbi:class F sortase [Alicyclobacillus sp.]|uniref:class F sortase n=1 Tax=Alicyclobacillus sp. TaxID=61169 RepID=UPI0025C2D10B|nr:class F sortase [Alicyclobacillus sp.]MCL6518105.1 class F sortase [Alicyclobacillus sp.]
MKRAPRTGRAPWMGRAAGWAGLAASLVGLGWTWRAQADGAAAPARRAAALAAATSSVGPVSIHTTPGAIPVSLVIPRLGVLAPIRPVGMDASGRMATVPDARVVAWYAAGPAPGEPGNALLAGHRDWNGALGALWTLPALRPGDDVYIATQAGLREHFRAASVQVYPADAVPDTVMDLGGPARVTLITCTGAFDRAAGGYVDRAVAVLTPAG